MKQMEEVADDQWLCIMIAAGQGSGGGNVGELSEEAEGPAI